MVSVSEKDTLMQLAAWGGAVSVVGSVALLVAIRRSQTMPGTKPRRRGTYAYLDQIVYAPLPRLSRTLHK